MPNVFDSKSPQRLEIWSARVHFEIWNDKTMANQICAASPLQRAPQFRSQPQNVCFWTVLIMLESTQSATFPSKFMSLSILKVSGYGSHTSFHRHFCSCTWRRDNGYGLRGCVYSFGAIVIELKREISERPNCRKQDNIGYFSRIRALNWIKWMFLHRTCQEDEANFYQHLQENCVPNRTGGSKWYWICYTTVNNETGNGCRMKWERNINELKEMCKLNLWLVSFLINSK